MIDFNTQGHGDNIVESYFDFLQFFSVGYIIWFFFFFVITSCVVRFGGKDTIFLGDL